MSEEKCKYLVNNSSSSIDRRIERFLANRAKIKATNAASRMAMIYYNLYNELDYSPAKKYELVTKIYDMFGIKAPSPLSQLPIDENNT